MDLFDSSKLLNFSSLINDSFSLFENILDEENSSLQPLYFPLIENEEKKEIIKEDSSLNFIFKNEQINENTKLVKRTRFTTFFPGEQNSDSKENLKSKENNEIKSISKNTKNIQSKKLGRKRKSEKKDCIHTKEAENNKIIKIKTYFGNNLHNFINNFLENRDKLKKLESKIHENIKKDFNIRLLNTSLKDIYLTTNIIKNKKQNNHNKEIIKKIYENANNKYYDIIQILNLTYDEALQIFNRNIKPMSLELLNKILDIEILNSSTFQKFPEAKDVFNQIIEKERIKKESEEFINKYIYGEKGIKELCINFNDWFNNKKGRNRINKAN